jgi:hypothetical protein
MVYPKFTVNTKAINMASVEGYHPHFDIIWSFEYAISGNNSTEAGFTVFLMDNIPLSGGNNSIDLGYSGLSSYTVNNDTIKQGISGSVLGVGFDTTGFFAVSALSGSKFIRDGIDELSRIPNSVSIRGAAPTYSYNTYNFNKALSSLDSDFKIVESGIKFKTIRARLGNVGKTLYIDYRYDADSDFKQLLQYDVNLSITDTTKYKVGLSFSTPISSNNTNSIGNIYLRNFHTEGSTVSGTVSIYNNTYTPDCFTVFPVVSTLPPDTLPIPKIPNIIIPLSSIDNVCTDISISAGRVTSINANTSITEDIYNFGYRIYMTSNNFKVLLKRVDKFRYESQDGKYILYTNDTCKYWCFRDVTDSIFPNLTSTNNQPIGTYSTYSTTVTATVTATYV